jgi:hypothetical protein
MKIQTAIATAALLGVLSSASALTTTVVSYEAPAPIKTIQHRHRLAVAVFPGPPEWPGRLIPD